MYEAYLGLNPNDVPPARHSTLLERNVTLPPQASTSAIPRAAIPRASTSAAAIPRACITSDVMDVDSDEDPDDVALLAEVSDQSDHEDIFDAQAPAPPTTQGNDESAGPSNSNVNSISNVNTKPCPSNVIQSEVDFFNKLFPATQPITNNEPQTSIKDKVDREIFTYMSYLQDKTVSPLSWWQIHKGELPHLSHIANKYLSAPPSSVESERLFSIGGQTYTTRRSNLLPETGEKLIKLCFNLKKFNSFYDSEIECVSNRVTENYSPESGESAVAVAPSGTR